MSIALFREALLHASRHSSKEGVPSGAILLQTQHIENLRTQLAQHCGNFGYRKVQRTSDKEWRVVHLPQKVAALLDANTNSQRHLTDVGAEYFPGVRICDSIFGEQRKFPQTGPDDCRFRFAEIFAGAI